MQTLAIGKNSEKNPFVSLNTPYSTYTKLGSKFGTLFLPKKSSPNWQFSHFYVEYEKTQTQK